MEMIEFLANDGTELSGLLYKSKEKTKQIVLSIHGMTSNCLKRRDKIIAKTVNEKQIDYCCFNNRGSDLSKYTYRRIDGKRKKELNGTMYEDVIEGYEDIVGAIKYLLTLGYEEIYLQGHSLGCTKIVYTYRKLKEENSSLLQNIKGIMLLSLIDIPGVLKFYLKDKYDAYISYAEEKELNGLNHDIMPTDAFIYPVSVQTFLRYAKKYESINMIDFKKDKALKVLNQIDKPLFMRWGNQNEMIMQDVKEVVEKVTDCLMQKEKDISYIDGADHGYTNKEEQLGKEILVFIQEKCQSL